MKQELTNRIPDVLESITKEAKSIGFDIASDTETGSLLRIFAASKPGGQLLELGTGTGVSSHFIIATKLDA